MPSITIKDIPEDLVDRLRRRAAHDKRSMNKEVVYLLDLALSGEMTSAGAAAMARSIEAQLQAWRQLAGRWESDLETADEIEQIYAARTQGRRGDL
jgi:plasmid stability protein